MTARHPNAPLEMKPQYSIKSEQWVIGAILYKPTTAWDRVSDVVTATDFHGDDHRRIFSAMQTMAEAGVPLDVCSVAETLRRTNQEELTGGFGYLSTLASAVPSAENVRHHATVVRDWAHKRRMTNMGNAIVTLSASAASPTELMVAVEQHVATLADEIERTGESKNLNGKAVASLVADHLQAVADGGNVGLKTGLDDLDDILDGLKPGNLVILAGRPAMGKSALAFNIAEHVVFGVGARVAIFTLEMSAAEIGVRLVSSRACIDATRLQRADMTDEEWNAVVEALKALTDVNERLIVEDLASLTPSALRSRARQLHRQQPLSLIVIDYLQLLTVPGADKRLDEVSAISRALKALAKELQVPVLALSQLSRKVEERADKRPMMSDLRESGTIEQDADKVVLLYRDEYYKPDTQDKGIAEAIVAKNRNGRQGVARLAFRGELTRFDNLVRR